MSYQALFTPRAVAVFGSVSEGKLAGILIDQLTGFGFMEVVAVNPKGNGKGNIAGYKSIREVEKEVDLALIATPAAAVADVLEECGECGVRAAIVISSGFTEAGNSEGEEHLKRIAERHHIRFIGPNCAGLINTHHRLAPTLQAYPPKGATAVISQSGAVGGAIMEWAAQHGLGISKFVSYGNGADLNQEEFLRYLKDDEETKVVALYIETVKDGAKFLEALKALTAVKPVIVIKSGKSNSGQRAALSHTGSLAGADAVYDAAFRHAGAIRVDSIDDMIDLAKGFQYLPPVTGNRVAIVTNSGGPGVMAADLGEALGLDIADTSSALRSALKAFLPAWAGFHNPIDMTVEGTGENYRKCIEACFDEYDAVLPIAFCPPYLDTSLLAKGMLDAFAAAKKPLFCALETGNGAAESIATMRENGLPNFPSAERAIRVIAGMAAYSAYKAKRSAFEVEKALPKGKLEGPLLEHEAMALLKESGIATPDFGFASTKREAVRASAAIGYPVVMKVVSPEILHKSDVGGVKLHINDDAAAGEAFLALEAVAQGKSFRGVVVYPMIKGGAEVILGLTVDRQFGPVIAFGMGGIYTEIMRDVALKIAPVNEAGAMEMITSIKGYPVLAGARGGKGVDLGILARMIAAFSQLPFRYPDIKEADLNPVFALHNGAYVGDVRIII